MEHKKVKKLQEKKSISSSSSSKSDDSGSCLSDESLEEQKHAKAENPKNFAKKYNPLIVQSEGAHAISNSEPQYYLEHIKAGYFAIEDHLYAENTGNKPIITSQLDKEMPFLGKNLPCQPSQAIFIAQDPDRMNLLKALISGPANTPYSYGLYIFDILLTENYPQVPPIIGISTGHKEVRLSPVFAENGSVHCHLLNNCDGNTEISWDPANSNLYQLLITIQALILDSAIVQKQAEFEDMPIDSDENIAYSNVVKYANARWGILEPLRKLHENNYEHFVSRFFRMNRENIKNIIKNWIEEAKNDRTDYNKTLLVSVHNPTITNLFTQKSLESCLQELLPEITTLLDSLPDFDASCDDYSENSSCSSDYEESKQPCLLREASQNDPQPPESSSLYYQTLKDLRFNTYDIFNSGNHVCLDQLGGKEEMASSLNRYTKEIKVLSQHLPCEPTGAVFVVMDTERMDLMKALISGTEDTPYAHGLYEFHIACPGNYPKKPPAMRIATTAKGTVRFNPNLYDDGYVCLSIINTWDGDPSERWNPGHSNILQVLLSIQVLVMDNMVIQKEPEFEHLEVNSPENTAYCNIVKYNNAKYAILETIKHPPEEFKEIVWRHFSLKRNAIMKTLDAWIEDAKSFKMKISNKEEDYLVKDHNPKTISMFKKHGFYNLLVKVRNEILTEIDKLEVLGEARVFYEMLEIPDENAEEPYTRSLSAFSYGHQDLFEAGGFRHSLFRYLAPIGHFNNVKARFQEEKDLLSQKLPCISNNSIFVVSDNERWDLLRVLVSGPSGTDYTSGLYLFDIVCTSSYPDVPPQVVLVTNGRCKVKFHQNLTESGEVVVPLLTGKWNSDCHLLDLLLEIQELFRTNYSIDTLDEELLEKWKTAQAIIRYNNLCYAIIDVIKNPPQEFADIITQHFDFKSKEIIKDIEKFILEGEFLKKFNDELLPNPYTIQTFQDQGYNNLLGVALTEISGLIEGSLGESDYDEKYDEDEENYSKKNNEIGMVKKYKKNLSDSDSDSSYSGSYEEVPQKKIKKKN